MNTPTPLIKPETLKGFRDYLPEAMCAREHLMEVARRVYRSYGFSPIDTPALEYSRILLGKGGEESDKQLFRFTDQGERDVAMRFDLTVPLARFTAQHLAELGTPFKRYHIGTVWRAEKPQKGRYREFVQCDFDTIGTESNTSDIETLFVIHDLMEQLGFSRFTLRVNHRALLNGVLDQAGLGERSAGVLRALDKLPKIGRAAVTEEMVTQIGATTEQAETVLRLAELGGEPLELLNQVEVLLKENETGMTGVNRLREMLAACRAAELPAERIQIDLSIARGLDYYTGTVYETFLNDLPGIGSVCSGGRYDNLAELFTHQKLPGVGASLGLDRLLAAMEELGLLVASQHSIPIFIPLFDKNRVGDYFALARRLRAAGWGVEVFPDDRGLGKQLKYADRKGFKLALIAGDQEFSAGIWQVKVLASGTQETVRHDELLEAIERILKC
ncbi:MAG: histidine--tRNA ligase [Planctomycetaceae bacterium]